MKDSAPADFAKFDHPDITANGEARARVELSNPTTLWFNTGTLCNIACANCYIESSPTNDRLVYLTQADVVDYLDQLETRAWGVSEIGFTGGEPYLNPDMNAMTRAALERGFRVLILTNAMRPMMRKRVRAELADLIAAYGDRLTFRVSVDHWSAELHDRERGAGSFQTTLAGVRWLRDQGARMAFAGRTVWGEDDAAARRGYAALYAAEGLSIDANDPAETVLFPEMDDSQDTPEITSACWDILGKSPSDVMCASSRMVVRRKGAERPSVVACTLLPYDAAFDLGHSLEEAEASVALNHPHCSKFCVLGGARCSG